MTKHIHIHVGKKVKDKDFSREIIGIRSKIKEALSIVAELKQSDSPTEKRVANAVFENLRGAILELQKLG